MARVRAAGPQTSDQPAATSRTMATVLVETKFQPPRRNVALVPRPSLTHRLTDPSPRSLTLVMAPPGWGKTTLLAEWQEADRKRSFAWLSLDGADSDPIRFWRYVLEALRRAAPTLGQGSLPLLGARGTSLVDTFLPRLLNDTAALDRELVLVLDDYHLVTSAQVSASVSYFLDHLPPTLSLAIATRSDPALSLARLRVQRALLEIGLQELRFDRADAGTFLNDVLGLRLEARDVERLQRRTEGWAAGLYLAALSLRKGGSARAFVENFTGEDRHLVEYLGTEVLEREGAEARRFLLRTSILGRLCGPLCDAVVGIENGEEMLEAIERSNLLLIPLDNRREWYRYHPLFAEVLQHELVRIEPDVVPSLHRRACEWYREHGAVDDALHHAFEATDVDIAVGLIVEHWNDVFNHGGLATVTAWLDALPADVVLADPRLCVARAWIAVDLGRVAEATRWTRAAEQAVEALAARPSESETQTAILRALLRFKGGDVGQASDAARRAIELARDDTPFSLTASQCLYAATLYWLGQERAAAEILEEAVERARESGNDLAWIYAGGYLALICAERGELERAEMLAERTLVGTADSSASEHFVAMMAHLVRARVQAADGALEQAESSLERALVLARRGAGRVELAYALVSLADANRLGSGSTQARDLIAEAGELVADCPDPGVMRERLERAGRLAQTGGRPAAGGEELSRRELAVLELLPTKLSQREIGDALYISLNTVKSHTKNIFRKLDAADRAEAVARARQRGLLAPFRPGAR